jgi:putative SOS response-associated peptidase YedK
MCGRIHVPNEQQFMRVFDLPDQLRLGYEETFNLAATQPVPVVRVVRGTGAGREAVLMRWGLIPYFAQGVAPKYSTINARVETIRTNPAFRGAWERGQRCILPAAGFYEWHTDERGQRHPFYVRPAEDDEIFSIAGLWDRSISATGASTLSCTVITMAANELLAQIHNDKQRMPALLLSEDIDTWLSGSSDEAYAVLKPYPADRMLAWPVAKTVNSAKNNGPELIRPVDQEPPPRDLFD